jgi:hypothetical protein
VAALAACTSILGDFTTGTGPSDASRDVVEKDAPHTDTGTDSAHDAGADAPFDAPPDAPPHDGPQYSAPVLSPVSLDGGPAGNLATSPAVTVADASVVVAFDYAAWGLSTNRGASFTNTSLPASSTITANGYPSISRDETSGTIYVSTNAYFSSSFDFNALALYISTNGGASFEVPTNAADPSLSTEAYVDVSHVAVDNASGVGQGVTYMAYSVYGEGPYADIRFTTDNAGTLSYSRPVTPDTSDQATMPWVAVAPNHRVYLVYFGTTGGSTPEVGIVSSNDQGATWSAPVTVATLHMAFITGTIGGTLGLEGVGADGGPEPVNLYASPQIVVNPVSGSLYVCYADATLGSDKANVYFTHSEDGGTTWSAPVQVNDDKTTRDQFQAAMAVTPDGTRLAIDFYDRRNDPANLAAERYGATATISGSTITFDANFKISTASFPLVSIPNGTEGYFSIHTGMTSDATYFYDSYTDCPSGDSTLSVRFARYGVLY